MLTLQEGAELLGGEELGRTRGETAQINEEEEGEATTPTKVKRTTTMAQTAEVTANKLIECPLLQLPAIIL